MSDHHKARGKTLEPARQIAISNDTTSQKYLSFVNFQVMQEKMTVLPCVDTSSRQFNSENYSLLSSNNRSVFAALQTAKQPLYSIYLPLSTSTTPQTRLGESHLLQTTQVQVISAKQEWDNKQSHLSKDNICVSSYAVSTVENIALGFIKTLSKTLQLNLCLSLICERIGLKLELKTHFKCD